MFVLLLLCGSSFYCSGLTGRAAGLRIQLTRQMVPSRDFCFTECLALGPKARALLDPSAPGELIQTAGGKVLIGSLIEQCQAANPESAAPRLQAPEVSGIRSYFRFSWSQRAACFGRGLLPRK